MQQRIPLEKISALAQQVLQDCVSHRKSTATLITLQGDLGAGKTTFVQALAQEIGITDTVQSPTYVLMKSYSIAFHQFQILVHIDAYRLEKPEEFLALNPNTFLSDPTALVCIEWPERLEGVLPAPDLKIEFSHVKGEEAVRMVQIQKAS